MPLHPDSHVSGQNTAHITRQLKPRVNSGLCLYPFGYAVDGATEVADAVGKVCMMTTQVCPDSFPATKPMFSTNSDELNSLHGRSHRASERTHILPTLRTLLSIPENARPLTIDAFFINMETLALCVDTHGGTRDEKRIRYGGPWWLDPGHILHTTDRRAWFSGFLNDLL